MANHSSASMCVETPHETDTTQITINDALDAGENIIDSGDFPQTDDATPEELEALIDIICRTGGAQAAGALFVLMGTLQNSAEPGALAHAAKHLAFTRCGELNLNGIVDAHLAVVEGELLAGTTLRS